MYKLVAIDLDETLYSDTHVICDANKKAIKKARENNVKIVPCSGRGPGFLGNLLEELSLNKKGEYSILGNGAIIVDNEKDSIIHCDKIPYSKIEELMKFGFEHNLCIQVFSPKNIYMYDINDDEYQRVKNFGKNITYINDRNLECLKDKTIFKMLFQNTDMNYLKSLEPLLEPITRDAITISYSSNRYIELNKLGTTKGVGLTFLANYLNIDIKDTIGIGDNSNDMELIKTAGLGACVNNAVDEIKEVSDYICELDNNQGGVSEVINHFILKQGR